MKKALDVIPTGDSINVDLSLAEFIDHSVMEHLAEYEENYIRRGGKFEIIGLDTHRTIADHPLSTRFLGMADPKKVKPRTLTSRQQKLKQLASGFKWIFDPSITRFVNDFERFHLFRYKTVDQVYNAINGVSNECLVTIQDVDFHEGEFHTKVSHKATVAFIELPAPIPQFTLEKEYLFDKLAALAGYDDIDFKDFERFSDNLRLKGNDEEAVRRFFSPSILKLLETNMNYRLESAGDSILVVGKERLMNESEIQLLAEFCLHLTSFIEPSRSN